MKKISIFLAMTVAALGFTACEDDKEPVYNVPTAPFVLNTPPMANQLYVLQDKGVIEFSCSQPDYGFSAVTTYTIDMTFDQQFTEAAGETPANYVAFKPVSPTSTKLQLNAADVAKAICEHFGIEGYSQYPAEGVPVVPLAFRVRAMLNGIPSSAITSNTVTLPEVKGYNPYPAVPRNIYLVGNPSNWTEPIEGNQDFYEAWAIEETGVGTDIYYGSLEIPAGEQYFRFYASLDGWGNDNALPSFGPFGKDGENQELVITSEATTVSAVPGKGSWYTPSDWAGGPVTFTIDMTDASDIKVTVKGGAVVKEAYAYLVGTMSGWAEPNEGNASTYENWRLVDVGITGIYTNTFDIPAGDVYFRVYPELTGWGPTPYAAAAAGDVNIDMTLGTPYSYEMGEGCWTFGWTGGPLTFTLDTTTGKMTVTAAE